MRFGPDQRDRRRRPRQPLSGFLRILWDNGSGAEHPARAQIVDVSSEGLRLRVEDRIPVRAQVSCNDPTLGIAGRGTVRYCIFVKGKYEIGLEFTGGTGWGKESAKAGKSHPVLEVTRS